MNTQDLNLNHWPPTGYDLAEAFARIEKTDDVVKRILLSLGDLPPNADDFTDKELGLLWGAKLDYQNRSTTGILTLLGSKEEVVIRGPSAGPPTGPFYVADIPKSKCVPTQPSEQDIQIQQRYRDHQTDDEMIFTPLEFASIRRFGRDMFTIETDPQILRTGVLGYKEWVSVDGVAHRVAVRCRK